jgi:Ni,Fe-hydrogenase III large subunit
MQADASLLILSTTGAPLHEAPAWADACAQALADGHRLVTLFGRPAAGRVQLTAVFESAAGLSVQRGTAPAGSAYPSLTAEQPCAQMFERELWEQTGLVPTGHPWLKPVRYQGARQQHMDEHPFFTVRGQDVHEVGVGPIHASVIEPGHFRFMCHGERIQHLEIQLGYQHRGVEALLLSRPPAARAALIETVAGDSSIAYAWGYAAALEALAGVPLPPEVALVRAVALELERVAMHLVGLTGLATDIAFLQGGTSYGRLRTAIINATMRVCGSRFGRGWLRPGGVRFGIDDTRRRDLLDTLAAFAKDIAEVNDLVLSARSVRARFQGTGTVSRQAALDLGLVGLSARASGVRQDARCDLPAPPYRDHPVELLTEDSGDCWARLRLRVREIDESLRWLRVVLDAGTPMPAQLAPLGPLAPDTLCLSVQEGFRGPVVQALETGAQGQVLQHKVQDPSLVNWFGLALSVRENGISDFPLCNKSFDLSYCGNDL